MTDEPVQILARKYTIIQATDHIELAKLVNQAITNSNVVPIGGVAAVCIHHREDNHDWWETWFYQALTL